MKITTTEEAGATVVQPTGAIDTRASLDFEKATNELLAGNVTLVVLDFTAVDMITSAGIRVLMMLGRKLEARSGALVLCALSEQVRTVFEIAGLADRLSIAGTRPEALARLSAKRAPVKAAAPKTSEVARLAARLLGTNSAAPGATAERPAGPSALATRVAQLLKERGEA